MPVTEVIHVVTLPGGRELAYLECGEPDGRPWFGFHGTPGSRLQLTVDPEPIRAAGVRFLAVDRPGYGHSTFDPRRTLPRFADDVAALADRVGVERFGVLGVSGGGPHAAACARFLGDRVERAAIVSGVAPMRGALVEAMGWGAGAFAALSRHVPVIARLPFAALVAVTRRFPEALYRVAPRFLPPADAAVLRRPEVYRRFVEEARLASCTTARAAGQDIALFASSWGFDLGDIRVPVSIWHGEADTQVPLSHGRHYAESIPGAMLRVCPGEGHFLVADRLGEILRRA